MLPALAFAAEPSFPYACAAPADEACPCGSGLGFDRCCALPELAERQLTRLAVSRWASARGVEAQLEVMLREVIRSAPGSGAGVPRGLGAGFSVLDALAPPTGYRGSDYHLPERLRLACFDFLLEEASLVREARTHDATQLPRPEHPGLALLFDRLLELRTEALLHASPRPVRALAHGELTILERLQRIRFVEHRSTSCPGQGPTHPGFELELKGASQRPLPMPRCSCGSDVGCLHVLAAIDLTLSRIVDPLRAGAWHGLADELATPDWSRALEALKDARVPTGLARRPRPEQLGRRPLAFVLGRDGMARLLVTPWLMPAAGDAPERAATGADLWDRGLDPRDEDRSVLGAFGILKKSFSGRGGVTARIERGQDLQALLGHPRVHLDTATGPRVAVSTGHLGLLVRPATAASGADAGVEVLTAVDGEPVPTEALEQPGKDDSSALVWIDRARARVKIVNPGAEPAAVAIVLASLARVKGRFPVEAEPALMEQLDVLQGVLPLAVDPGLVAEDVPPSTTLLVRLELLAHGLAVTLLALPLVGATPQPPGAGPARVLSVVNGRRRQVWRALEAERAAALALVEALQLPDPESAALAWELDDDAAAHALVTRVREAAADRASDDPGSTASLPPLLVEWVGHEVRCAGAFRLDDFKVKVGGRKRDWFGVDGRVEVDGVSVGLAALLRALREGRTVLRADDGALLALGGELAARLAGLEQVLTRDDEGDLAAGPAAALTIADLVDDGAVLDASPDFLALRDRMRASAARPCPVPETFQGALRPYQAEGFRWLARLSGWAPGGVLADDMGLGKTLQALALLCERAGKGPALVLAPTSVCANWRDEAARFAPGLRVSLYRDADRSTGVDALRGLGPGDVLVASYGLLVSNAAAFEEATFATLVIDEAQAVKNAATRRAQVVRALKAEFTVALSGTPLENHLGELWSLYRIVYPALLGSWASFKLRFAEPIEQFGREDARLALAATLRPFLLRRTKAEVAPELPARTELVVPVVLSPPELQRYEESRRAIVAHLQKLRDLPKAKRRIHFLAALTELRLLACHPRLRDRTSALPSAKLERFLDLLPELSEGGHRTLIFSQWTRHLALVREALDAAAVRYLYLDGETPPEARDALVRRFQGGEGALFLVSLRAGGSGLNLTGADYVVHLNPWWNPAVEDQATDRAHRIGQTRPVTVLRLVSRDTIEEKVRALQEKKRRLVDGVLEGMGAASRLSLEELEALVMDPPRPGPPRGPPGEEVESPRAGSPSGA
ncbi:MAG: SNF2-related protein [Anaeromyxobacteraceae bacterium]